MGLKIFCNLITLQVSGHQAPGPGRARRDAAARAMQGWHSQRLLGNGEVGDPIIKVYGGLLLSSLDVLYSSFPMMWFFF